MEGGSVSGHWAGRGRAVESMIFTSEPTGCDQRGGR